MNLELKRVLFDIILDPQMKKKPEVIRQDEEPFAEVVIPAEPDEPKDAEPPKVN